MWKWKQKQPDQCHQRKSILSYSLDSSRDDRGRLSWLSSFYEFWTAQIRASTCKISILWIAKILLYSNVYLIFPSARKDDCSSCFTNSHWLIGCSLLNVFFRKKMKKAPIGIEPTTSILDGRCPSFYLVIFCGLLRSQLYPSLYDLLQWSVAVELFFFCVVWGICDTADINLICNR